MLRWSTALRSNYSQNARAPSELLPMTTPRIEYRGEALYLTDPQGQRWRVHDTRYTQGKPHRLALGDPCANTRYFVAQTGERRAYTFTRGDRRDQELSTLSEHFRNAGYLGKLPPFDGNGRGPR